MAVQIVQRPDKSIIILDKNISVGSEAADIQNVILDLIEGGSKIIEVDLSKLAYINSWGIGSLMHAHTTCTNRNVQMFLTGLNEKIHEILNRVNLHQIFAIREDM